MLIFTLDRCVSEKKTSLLLSSQLRSGISQKPGGRSSSNFRTKCYVTHIFKNRKKNHRSSGKKFGPYHPRAPLIKFYLSNRVG